MSYPAPPPNWIGTWPPPNGPSGFPVPPAIPHGYSHGEHTLKNGSWKAPPGLPGYPHNGVAAPYGPYQNGAYGQWPTKPPPKPGSAEYWATELKDNGLQLENMDNKQAPSAPPVDQKENTHQSSNRTLTSTSSYPTDGHNGAIVPSGAVWAPPKQEQDRHVHRDSSQPPPHLRHRPAEQATSTPPRSSTKETDARYREREYASRLTTPQYTHSRSHSRESRETPAQSQEMRRRSDDMRTQSRQDAAYTYDPSPHSRPQGHMSSSPYSNPRQSRDSYDADISPSYHSGHSQHRHDSSPYHTLEAHSTSVSRAATLAHIAVREPSDILHSTTRALQRARTMPVNLAEPQPQKQPSSGYNVQRELRPTFSPDIVRTPIHYEAQETREPRYVNERISPEEEEEAFWRDEGGRFTGKKNLRRKDKEKDKDKYRSSNRAKDKTREELSKGVLDDHRYDSPSRALGPSHSFSASPSKPQAPVTSGLSRHASMPPNVSTTDPNHPNNLSYITEEPASLSPIFLDEVPLPEQRGLSRKESHSSSTPQRNESSTHDYRYRSTLQSSPQYLSSSSSSLSSRSPRDGPTHPPYHSSSASSGRIMDISPYHSSSSRERSVRPSPISHPPCPPLTPPEANHPPCPPLTPSPKEPGFHVPIPSPSHMHTRYTHPLTDSHQSRSTQAIASSVPRQMYNTSSSPAHYGTPPRSQNTYPQDPYSSSLGRNSAAPTSSSNSPIPVHTPSRSQSHQQSSLSRSPSKIMHPQSQSTPKSRNVRLGLWNRRGDHFTAEGFLVYCPPARTYPKELDGYPEEGFMDHTGQKRDPSPGRRLRELPESIAHGGKPPERPYDTFINYILVPNSM